MKLFASARSKSYTHLRWVEILEWTADEDVATVRTLYGSGAGDITEWPVNQLSKLYFDESDRTP